jgi:hypothetical protein
MVTPGRKSNYRRRRQRRLVRLLTAVTAALAAVTALIQLLEILLSVHSPEWAVLIVVPSAAVRPGG